MREIGKAVFCVGSSQLKPSSSKSAIRDEIISKFGVTCVAAIWLEIGEMEIAAIIKAVFTIYPCRN
jgi:hypothetical protein